MRKFISIALLFLTFAVSNAKVVVGSVVSGDEALQGVIVTDGVHFSQTRSDGKFKMKISRDAQFVYIITPSGYVGDWSDGAPQFYQKAQGKKNFVFDLKKIADVTDTYNLIAVGDPQPKNKKQADLFAGAPLTDLCQTISQLSAPSVGVVLGDVCFDNVSMMQNWKKSILATGIPFYVVPGNHDYDRALRHDDKAALASYREHFGPENHAFFIGNDLVIMLDNIIYSPNGKYYEGYSDEVIQWVRSLMKHIKPGVDLYIVQHSPILGRTHKKKPIQYAERFLESLDGHRVHIISGHNHMNDNFHHSPEVTEHNISAICGTWWMASYCKDGTPQGYKVYTKANGKLEWYYRTVGKDKDFQYEIFLPGECQQNPESLVVNLWDYDPDWIIEWYEDGKPMGNMTRVKEYHPRHSAELETAYSNIGKPVPHYMNTYKADHYFSARPSDKATEIMIVIKNPFGKTFTERIPIK